MKEIRIDLRDPQQNDPAEGRRCAKLCFKLSQTMPYTEEYESLSPLEKVFSLKV